MKESYQEFVNKLLKKGSHPHHLTHCLGSRDAWKWVRKNKWKALKGIHCDQLLYSKIINEVNQILVEQLLQGHRIVFPHNMGNLALAAVPTKVDIENGEVKTNYRTDWNKTLDLWYEDEEARNSHKPVKRITKEIYYLRYSKAGSPYHNRRYYRFRQNRSLGKAIGSLIREGKVNVERTIFI